MLQVLVFSHSRKSGTLIENFNETLSVWWEMRALQRWQLAADRSPPVSYQGSDLLGGIL